MTINFNKAAWFIAALTILAWAIMPRVAMAMPVRFPELPVLDTIPLPPIPMTNPADTDR